VDRLTFVGEQGMHVLFGNTIYEVSLEGAGCYELAQDLPIGGVVSSDDGMMAAWSCSTDLYDAKELMLKNLMTDVESTVRAGEGERVIPITFFGNDLVYGVARATDIREDISGHTLFAMHSI
jgi:hypothetical protein